MPTDPTPTPKGNVFTNRVGPFPVWVYLAGAGGVYLFLRNRSATQNAAGSSLTGTTDPTGATLSAIPGGAMTTNGGTLASGSTDNNSWASRAAAFLEARGMDPLQAAAAIQAYLNGYPLSSQQQGLLDIALGGVGSPPQPIAPIQITAAPQPVTNPGPVWPPTAPDTPAPAAPSAFVPPAGGLVNFNDPSVPLYYKMGFPDQASYDAVYGAAAAAARPPASGSGWTRSWAYGRPAA